MAYNDFINKIRYYDNMLAKWILRHFYVTFFHIVLFIIFLFWFVNMFKVIDASESAWSPDAVQHILSTQSVNLTIIVFLMLLNSFWMLYMFTGIQRIATILKDLGYQLGKMRWRGKDSPPSS